MKLRKRVAELRSSGFARATGVLVGGAAFAQLVMALALPFLTRLYTPGDFSLFAVIAGLLTVLSVSACLRFDIAIPLPEHDDDAINVLALALCFTLLVSLLVAVAVFIAPQSISSAVRQPELQPYLWLLPLGVLLTGAYSALQLWAVRHKQFTPIARSKIGQALVGAGTQIGLGFLGFAPLGLLLGQVLNAGAGVVGLAGHNLAAVRRRYSEIRVDRMRAMFRRYNRFPKYSALEALFNAIGMQLPLIIIAAVALGPEAGYLILAMTVMQAPMGLIGNAVAQVYLSRAAEQHRAGNLGLLTRNVFGQLIKTGVGPLIFAAVVAPDMFALIFGEEWRRAGELVRWMTPWLVMQFLAVPVSMALHVTEHQKAALLLQLCGLVLRTLLVLVVARLSVSHVAEAYALSGFVFYGLYLMVVMRVVGSRITDLIGELRSGGAIVLAWVVLGLLVAYALPSLLSIWQLP